MMKNTLSTALIIFVLGNLCRLGLPWWSLVPIAAVTAWFLAHNGWKAFFGGLLGGFVLWYASAWLVDSSNGSMLSAKVGQLFMGVQGSQLMLASGLLGGLLGGFGALSGSLARDMFTRPSTKRNYLQERRR